MPSASRLAASSRCAAIRSLQLRELRLDASYQAARRRNSTNSLHHSAGAVHSSVASSNSWDAPPTFFLPRGGERVASYLSLCWDTVDNDLTTQMAAAGSS